MAYVAIADRDNAHALHDPQSFITKYIWSQDPKVIAIKYRITAIAIGLVALTLSVLMRLQLGFPQSFHLIAPQNYYQYITLHGMIMVIYLLTALFLGGFGNYLIPLMCGARDMVFPYLNMISYWVYLLAVLVLVAGFFVPGGATGAGWTLYPPASHSLRLARRQVGNSLHAGIARHLHSGVHDGRPELRDHGAAGPLPRHDHDAHAAVGVGHFHGDGARPAGLSGVVRIGHHDDSGLPAGHQLFHAGGLFDGSAIRIQRRQPAAVSALVLVLWASGSLYRRTAGVRHRLRSAQHPCKAAYIRLSHDGAGDSGDRLLELRGVGAPYVCERHESILRLLLRHHHAHHRRAHRAQGLQLGADAVARRHSSHRADAVCHRVHLHLHQRRLDRPVSRPRAGGCPAVRDLFRGGALPSRHGSVADPGGVRRALQLVPENDGTNAERHSRQDPFLGYVHRHVHDLPADVLPWYPGCAAPLLRIGFSHSVHPAVGAY